MSVDWAGLVSLIGPASILVALVVLAQLSRRLGSVVRMPRYYLGFYLAAGLMTASMLARLLVLGRGPAMTIELSHDPLWVLLLTGLPALALTTAVVVAWRYWSWLLAERS